MRAGTCTYANTRAHMHVSSLTRTHMHARMHELTRLCELWFTSVRLCFGITWPCRAIHQRHRKEAVPFAKQLSWSLRLTSCNLWNRGRTHKTSSPLLYLRPCQEYHACATRFPQAILTIHADSFATSASPFFYRFDNLRAKGTKTNEWSVCVTSAVVCYLFQLLFLVLCREIP